jgi:beta-N-acetylhexosaminidase
MLMPGFTGTRPDPELLDRVRRGRLGGLFLLARNVRDATQVRELTAQLRRAAAESSQGILPFIATDFEGGSVNALHAITGATPAAAALAGTGAVALEAQGAYDAALLASLGFNTNLAPVADVLTAPSEVIGSRAFAADPDVVASLSRAYLRGLQQGRVLGVMKHFPAHGATAGDSHLLLPTVDRSTAELETIDLLPYRQAIAAGEVHAVMVGHLLVPAIDPELPASLSGHAITGLLRERLGFQGLAFTDELKMGAISRRLGVVEAALAAVGAGADVLLADYTGTEQDLVAGALARACLAGHLPAGRLEQSVARILQVKLAFGLAGPEITALYSAQRALAADLPLAPDHDRLGGVALHLPDGAAGRFYTEGAGGGDFGYPITDEGDIAFWTAYAALGGPTALGYPISQRFELDGAPVQLTQRALLRWDPHQETVTLVNAFELFSRAGAFLGWPGCLPPLPSSEPISGAPHCSLDGWLQLKGIPAPIADDGSQGDFRRAVAIRLGWLTNDAIRDAYLADPAGAAGASPATNPVPPRHRPEHGQPWAGSGGTEGMDGTEGTEGPQALLDDAIPWAAIERYGLPMSRPEQFGPFLAQRFQRAVLQLWLDEVPAPGDIGGPALPPPGTVTAVLAGELLRDSGLVPRQALVPTTADGQPGAPPELPAPPQPPQLPEPPAATPSPAPATPAPPATPPATASPAPPTATISTTATTPRTVPPTATPPPATPTTTAQASAPTATTTGATPVSPTAPPTLRP